MSWHAALEEKEESIVLKIEKANKNEQEIGDHQQSCLVLCLLLSTHKSNETKDWQRISILNTRVWCNEALCTIIINPKICSYVIFEDAIHKLDLTTEPHPNPYNLDQVNKTNLKVTEKCVVTYASGGLLEMLTVMCY